MSAEPIYPKPERTRNMHLDRRWRLDCSLVYGDSGGAGVETWSKGYRTRTGARLAAWWHYHLASWGGSVELVDTASTPHAPLSGHRSDEHGSSGAPGPSDDGEAGK